MFVALLTFVAPAPFFPAMARDLNVGVPLLGQVVAAMLLVSAAIGLVAGPLADSYGHRRLILLGLVSAAICLFTFGLAPTFAVLLVGALAGGLGNAAVLGPSLAVAGTYFAGAEARRALGWATACMAGSAIVGRASPDRRREPHRLAGGVHRRRRGRDRSRPGGSRLAAP